LFRPEYIILCTNKVNPRSLNACLFLSSKEHIVLKFIIITKSNSYFSLDKNRIAIGIFKNIKLKKNFTYLTFLVILCNESFLFDNKSATIIISVQVVYFHNTNALIIQFITKKLLQFFP